MRIGILGGTFNPPHVAHLVCAQEAYVQLALDQVMLVPARIPPHKPVEDEPGAGHRLKLCRLAILGDEERLAVSDLEIARDGPSYTVDTLELLHSRTSDSELFLIVGADIAAGLPQWHQPDTVLSLATLAVAGRPGTGHEEVQGALAAVPGGERAKVFEMPEIGISSTMIRSRVHAGYPVRYLVPDAVAGYIVSHGLYRSAAG